MLRHAVLELATDQPIRLDDKRYCRVEEAHACRPEPDYHDQNPGATADRYGMTTECPERDQAKAGQRGAQGCEGEMRHEIQANRYQRKAGGPKHHDRHQAQGGTDVQGCAFTQYMSAISVLIQINAEAA